MIEVISTGLSNYRYDSLNSFKSDDLNFAVTQTKLSLHNIQIFLSLKNTKQNLSRFIPYLITNLIIGTFGNEHLQFVANGNRQGCMQCMVPLPGCQAES